MQRAHPGLPGRRWGPLLPRGPLLWGVASKAAVRGLHNQPDMQALIAQQAASLPDLAWPTHNKASCNVCAVHPGHPFVS